MSIKSFTIVFNLNASGALRHLRKTGTLETDSECQTKHEYVFPPGKATSTSADMLEEWECIS